MILARTTSTQAARTRRIALIVPRATTAGLTGWMLPTAHAMKVGVISMFYLKLITPQIDEQLLTSSTINYYRILLSAWTV